MRRTPLEHVGSRTGAPPDLENGSSQALSLMCIQLECIIALYCFVVLFGFVPIALSRESPVGKQFISLHILKLICIEFPGLQSSGDADRSGSDPYYIKCIDGPTLNKLFFK